MQPNFHSKISGVYTLMPKVMKRRYSKFKLLIFCKSLLKNLEMSIIKMHIPAILLWSQKHNHAYTCYSYVVAIELQNMIK